MVVLGTCLVLAVAIVAGAALLVRDDAASDDHRYEIPTGTAARIEAGEPLEILPSELHVQAGDTLTVVNHDDEAHFVGVASVEPGATMTYRFPAPGQYESTCTVHRRGAIDIYVSS